MFFQSKSEPRAAAPSAGPVMHSQPPQSTSSCAPTLANTVRIEKLSDEEDEEVDITDDMSDDGNDDDKPQTVHKTEFLEQEQPAGSEIHKDNSTEQKTEAGLTETECQPCHTSQSQENPQTLSFLPCSEKTGLTGLDGRESPPLNDLKTEAQTASELMTNENKGQSSQSVTSAQTDQLETTCSDGAGKTAVFV